MKIPYFDYCFLYDNVQFVEGGFINKRAIDIVYDEATRDDIALALILETIHDVFYDSSSRCIEKGENTTNDDARSIAEKT